MAPDIMAVTMDLDIMGVDMARDITDTAAMGVAGITDMVAVVTVAITAMADTEVGMEIMATATNT